jgi:uncharacterized lipoprotein YmbA
METLSAALKPAFYIALYHQDHCVVMGIRGTDAATDAITDLNAHSELFEGGYAHSGMLAAAKWLLQNEGESLRKCFESYPVRVCPAHKLSLQGFKFYDES